MPTRSFGIFSGSGTKVGSQLDKMAAEGETDDGELLLQRLSQAIKAVSLKL